jgi:hypothetical protein
MGTDYGTIWPCFLAGGETAARLLCCSCLEGKNVFSRDPRYLSTKLQDGSGQQRGTTLFGYGGENFRSVLFGGNSLFDPRNELRCVTLY